MLMGGNRSRKLVLVWGERSWWWYCSDCRLCRAQEDLSLRPDRYGGSRPFRVFLLKLCPDLWQGSQGLVAPKTSQ